MIPHQPADDTVNTLVGNMLLRHLLDVPEPSFTLATTTGARGVFEPLDRVYTSVLPGITQQPHLTFSHRVSYLLTENGMIRFIFHRTFMLSNPPDFHVQDDNILAYFKTGSALHAFRETHTEDTEHPVGPAVVSFWNSLRRGPAMGDSARKWGCK
ncbi:hypothetical protein EDC04DRAFT_82961 [Pisolithus marmoratus]|nr:hypothetical protein EDC04DRAFT_82961 [Pisolithus marmoratus]